MAPPKLLGARSAAARAKPPPGCTRKRDGTKHDETWLGSNDLVRLGSNGMQPCLGTAWFDKTDMVSSLPLQAMRLHDQLLRFNLLRLKRGPKGAYCDAILILEHLGVHIPKVRHLR